MLLYYSYLKAGISLHVLILLVLSVSNLWIPGSHVASDDSSSSFRKVDVLRINKQSDSDPFSESLHKVGYHSYKEHRSPSYTAADTSRSMQVLMLLPVLRLLSVSMPVFSEMTIYHYVYIYLPMLLPAYLIVRNQNLSPPEIGLTLHNSLIYIPVSIIMGALIGAGEYMIINSGYLIPDLSLSNLLKLSIIMICFVGLIEELVFRSLLQTRLENSFGKAKGLFVTSLLFAVMHSGYGNIDEILYAFIVGSILGYMFQRTRSLLLISLTHGFVNIFLFGLIPLLPYFEFLASYHP
ncbi:MAG: CPBP family intramembrane metalloprotease [Methanosarcinaceae archaeon]|nr:CPBP family intramembrane metalloprotease [Methanosarcinaceae archaeon]